MLKTAVGLMCLVFVASSSLAYAQQLSNPRINQADMKALMDARIAVVKDGLQLKPDQAKYWPPVEDAMRAAAQAQYARITSAADQLAPGREVDPMTLFRGRADAIAERAAGMKRLADAWEPLSKSLNPEQKEAGASARGSARHAHAVPSARRVPRLYVIRATYQTGAGAAPVGENVPPNERDRLMAQRRD